MIVQFIGHAAFYVEHENFRALIDPFITGNPQAKAEPDDFENISHIFVTHGHGDHMGDTIDLAKKHQALVICNFEIANYLAGQGVKAHPMHIGGRTTFDFGTVKMTPALHGSGIQTPDGVQDGGNPGGFLITIADKTIYHAGDTGLTMDMKLLEGENIDLALLPIGGNFTMDVRDASLAADFIKAKTIVPMHYDTFPLIAADPQDLKDQVSCSEVCILKANDRISID